MGWSDNLDRVLARHQELSDTMASGDLPPESFRKYSKEYADLTPLVEKAEAFKAAQA